MEGFKAFVKVLGLSVSSANVCFENTVLKEMQAMLLEADNHIAAARPGQVATCPCRNVRPLDIVQAAAIYSRVMRQCASEEELVPEVYVHCTVSGQPS